MKQWTVNVGGKEYDVDAPDEATAWAWANQYHASQAQKPGYAADAAVGGARGLAQFIPNLAQGLAHGVATGADFVGATDYADSIRDKIKRQNQALRSTLDTTIGTTSTGAGQVAENVAKIGPNFLLGPAAVPGVMTSIVQPSMEQLDQLNEAGVDPQTAVRTAQISAAGDAALGLVPGAGLLKGAGINVLSGGASDLASNLYLKSKGYDKQADEMYNPVDPVARATDAILGGIGGKVGGPPKKAKTDEEFKKRLNEVTKPKVEEDPNLERWKAEALKKQQEAQNTPIYVDKDGTAGVDPRDRAAMPDPNSDEAIILAIRRAIEAQRPPQTLYAGQDGRVSGELAPRTDPYRSPEMEGVPTLPEEGGRPLPGLNTIEDTVPLLPGTPDLSERIRRRAEGTLRDDTPLPTVDPRMAATGDLLDFAGPQTFDRGVRPTGTDGTPLRGMSEDVPTIDFPLRQEVLEQPEIKAAIDNFRMEAQRLQQEGNQAGLDQLVADFTAGMQRLGIANPADAYARALYEGGDKARYLETGIRRSGERNTNLATMPEVPQLPFGGKKLTGPEKAQAELAEKEFKERLRRVGQRKGQGGQLNVGVFYEGFRKLTNALSKLTDQPWLAKRFPATHYMTNDDGTPMVMLHGTRTGFSGELEVNAQGVHAGFTVPSHLILQMAEIPAMKPRSLRRLIDTTTGPGFNPNLRPVVLKRGNYPFYNVDFGYWSPDTLLGNVGFRTFLVEQAVQNGKVLNYERIEKYRDSLKNAMSGKEESRIFSRLLKEAGIDGLFYPNGSETLDSRSDYQKLEKKEVYLPEYGYAVPEYNVTKRANQALSFVTWDASNLQSVFDDGTKKGVPNIGASQRGGAKGTWNPYAVKQQIVQAVESALDFAKKGFPKSQEAEKQSVFNNIPGMKKEKFITKDAEFTPQLKEKILSEPDGSKWWAFTPGRVARQQINNVTNEMVATIGRYWENARNRYELLIDRDVEPMKKALNRVLTNNKDTGILATIFQKEQELGVRLSEEQLREAGASDSVIEAYNGLRDNFDKVIAKINEVRSAKGQKLITPQEAYMSARWLGPWKAQVRDKDGKLLFWIGEPTIAARKRAMDYIKMHEPDLVVSEVKYDSKVNKNKDTLAAGYNEMLKLLGEDDPVVQRISELLKQMGRETTANIGGVEKHFKKKSGIGGYAGDRPWADTVADQKAMFRQQVEYIQSSLMWAEQQKALERTNEIINDPDIKAKRPNDVEYVKELAKMEMGWDTFSEIRGMEEFVAKYTGLNTNAYAQGLGLSKSLFYMHKLGLNIPYMAVSVMQPLMVMPSAMLANKAKLGSTWYGAQVDGWRLIARQMDEEYFGQYIPPEIRQTIEKIKGDEFTDDAINYAYANRVTEVNQLTDTRDVEAGPTRQKLEKTVGFTISVPELMARSWTYMGFVHGLKHQFDTSTFDGRMELYQKAAELTKEVMGDYNPEQKAAIYQRLGLVGNALSTLQTFMINQAYQMWKYSKMAAPKKMGGKGDPRPLLAHMTMMLMFAGATGMIGVDDADDLLNILKEYVMSDKTLVEGDAFGIESLGKWKDFSIKGAMIQHMPDLVTHGAVSKISDMNLYTRFSMGDFMQNPLFEGSGTNVAQNYFPFITELVKQGVAAKDLVMGDEIKRREAGYVLTPSGFRGAYEELVPGVKRGEIVPQMSDMRFGQVRRPEENVTERILGFRDYDEQREIDRGFNERVRDNITNKRVEALREKFQRALISRNGEAMKEHLVMAVKMGHNPTSWVQNAGQTIQNSMQTLAEREIVKLSKLKAPNQNQIKQLQIWIEIRNAGNASQ